VVGIFTIGVVVGGAVTSVAGRVDRIVVIAVSSHWGAGVGTSTGGATPSEVPWVLGMQDVVGAGGTQGGGVGVEGRDSGGRDTAHIVVNCRGRERRNELIK